MFNYHRFFAFSPMRGCRFLDQVVVQHVRVLVFEVVAVVEEKAGVFVESKL